MRRFVLLAGSAVVLAALLLTAWLFNIEYASRFPSPGGQFELVMPESGGFYIVPAGSQVSASDEVLRTKTDCPELPADRVAMAEERPADWEPICGSSVRFGWSSPTEVEFTVSNAHILKQVEQAHGVSVRVRRDD